MLSPWKPHPAPPAMSGPGGVPSMLNAIRDTLLFALHAALRGPGGPPHVQQPNRFTAKMGTATAHWPRKGRLFQEMTSVVPHQASKLIRAPEVRQTLSASRYLLFRCHPERSAAKPKDLRFYPSEAKQGNTLKVLPSNSPESNDLRPPHPPGGWYIPS